MTEAHRLKMLLKDCWKRGKNISKICLSGKKERDALWTQAKEIKKFAIFVICLKAEEDFGTANGSTAVSWVRGAIFWSLWDVTLQY